MGEQRVNKDISLFDSNKMKILIHSPPENIHPDEKKRFLQRIHAYRIPIEKNEVKDMKQYLYFVRGQYKYSCTDPGLIEVVEKMKEQSMTKKGRWEGPWDIQEEEEKGGIISQPPVLPLNSVVVVNEKDTEYHPSREFATWNIKIQRVNRQFKRNTPFPVWLYNIRNVHCEMGKMDWVLIATERVL
jgi:hypothetical protein